jgi:acyl-coenzyme A synthetase/AMP-(fatty) acid ligase
MFFSGGTTGTAKGITHLAHDFVLVPERQGRFWEYRESDVVFATSKKYFTHGLWPGLLIPLYWGATAVLIRRPPLPELVLETMAKAKVTKLVSVPTVLKNMIEHVRMSGAKPQFPALAFVVSASEKIPPEIFARFHQQFGVELFDSIGSSEITYEWIANRPKEFRRGSLGKPIFGYEVRLVAPDRGDVTEPNVPGEAWIKSKTACFFYWRKYDKSRETFIGEWTRTGDNLTFDEDGFFWFSGRDKQVALPRPSSPHRCHSMAVLADGRSRADVRPEQSFHPLRGRQDRLCDGPLSQRGEPSLRRDGPASRRPPLSRRRIRDRRHGELSLDRAS